MSRSCKKLPIVKDKNSKYSKQKASRAVRRAFEVPNGRSYAKFYCSWDICDYRSRGTAYTAEEFRRIWFDLENKELDWARRRFNSWKTAYRYWLSCYKNK